MLTRIDRQVLFTSRKSIAVGSAPVWMRGLADPLIHSGSVRREIRLQVGDVRGRWAER